MSLPALTAASATRKVDPALLQRLQGLQAGQKIRITQFVRVGSRKWSTVIDGTYREVQFLATGLATERVPEDDIVVPTLHFTKANGELASVALDEHSQVEVL